MSTRVLNILLLGTVLLACIWVMEVTSKKVNQVQVQSKPVRLNVPVHQVVPEARKLTTYEMATNGDPVAQFKLGYAYETGQGVDQSYSNAACWYTKASAGHFPPAVRQLSSLYLLGLGVAADLTKATNLLAEAAASGDAPAQGILAGVYLTGQFGVTNTEQAYLLAKKGSEKDDPGSRFILGTMLLEGIASPKDVLAGYKLILQSYDSAPDTSKLLLIKNVERTLDTNDINRVKASLLPFGYKPVSVQFKDSTTTTN